MSTDFTGGDIKACTSRLKKFLRLCVRLGVSYADLSKLASSSEIHIEPTAVKQFVYRDVRSPRRTPLFEALIASLEEIPNHREIREKTEYHYLVQEIEKIKECLIVVSPLVINDCYKSIIEKVKKVNKGIYLDKEYYYLRVHSNVSRESDNVINKYVRICLQIFELEHGEFKFFMKVPGKFGKKVVVGEVLECISGLYFTGISLPVNEALTNEEFHTMSMEELLSDNTGRYVISNPIGFEYVTIPKNYLSDVFIPVSFSTVDSVGRVIFGNAMFINIKLAERFPGFNNIHQSDNKKFNEDILSDKYSYISNKYSFKNMKTYKSFSEEDLESAANK